VKGPAPKSKKAAEERHRGGEGGGENEWGERVKIQGGHGAETLTPKNKRSGMAGQKGFQTKKKMLGRKDKRMNSKNPYQPPTQKNQKTKKTATCDWGGVLGKKLRGLSGQRFTQNEPEKKKASNKKRKRGAEV